MNLNGAITSTCCSNQLALHSMRSYLFIALLFVFGKTILAQDVNISPDPKINALNNYVFFINESTHGLLIVQRMLENFNQDINKYVDLESVQLNFYSNKDLPANIFIDEENWFYDTSPYEWYEKAILESKILGSDATSLNLHTRGMKKILSEVNAKRFEIEEFINTNNLEEVEAQQGVYDLLERCVVLYEDFFQSQRSLESAIRNTYSKIKKESNTLEFPKFRMAVENAYNATRAIMIAIRKKKDEDFEKYIEAQRIATNTIVNMEFKEFNSTRMISKRVLRSRDNMLDQLDQSLRSVERFYNTGIVDPDYKLYGKFYYYYNSDLINKFNRYGNGIVFEINRILDYLEMPILRYTELPHYYKVIYPKKITKDIITSTDENIQKLPEKLRDRTIKNTGKNVIKVDSDLVEFELFDHFIEDGDIVDINYNGDWIIDSLLLVSKPKKIKLKLNQNGRNYLLLHAKNVGSRPPNTMAIKYKYRGREKRIIMSSDLNKSELIEIVKIN